MDNSTLLKGRCLKAHFSGSLDDAKYPKWKIELKEKAKYKTRWQSEAGAPYGEEKRQINLM